MYMHLSINAISVTIVRVIFPVTMCFPKRVFFYGTVAVCVRGM